MFKKIIVMFLSLAIRQLVSLPCLDDMVSQQMRDLRGLGKPEPECHFCD